MRKKVIQEIQREPAPVSESENASNDVTTDIRHSRRERGKWYAEVLALPFSEFLIEAYRFHHQMVQEQPEWHTDLFWFTWLVRGHPDVAAHLSHAKRALRLVEGHIIAWTQARKRRNQEPPFGFQEGDAWLEWFGISKTDARVEFVDVWEKARFTPGHDPLEQAADAAKRLPLGLPPEVVDRRPIGEPGETSSYQFFVSVSGHLQVLVGDNPIKLPCANVAALMGVSKMTVSRYRRWAEQDGFLRIVKPHKFRSGSPGDATEFRFDVSRWKVLNDKAEPGAAAAFVQQVPG